MTRYVHPGHTFALRGTLLSEQTLIAKAGNAAEPGGIIYAALNETAIDFGTIDLLGGNSASATGGELLIQGHLFAYANSIIAVSGGNNGGGGGLLQDNGLFTSSGTLIFGAGLSSPGAQCVIAVGATMYTDGSLSLQGGIDANSAGATLSDAGHLYSSRAGSSIIVGSGVAGALLEVTGTLTTVYGSTLTVDGSADLKMAMQGDGTLSVSGSLSNDGTIELAAGSASSFFEGNGGFLVDTGTITNTGVMIADGGRAYSYSKYSIYGGTINISGVLINHGLLALGAGAGVVGEYYKFPAFGATLNDTGLLANTGSIVIEGSGTPASPGHYGSGIDHGGELQVAASLSNTGVITAQEGSEIYITEVGTFTNASQLTLQGGQKYPGYYGFGLAGVGAVLSDTGTFLNRGMLTISGGHSGYVVQGFGGTKFYVGVGGYGATASVSGSLTNSGMITVGGGGGVYSGNATYTALGTGGLINVSGVLTNTGTIALLEAQASQAGVHAGTGGYGLGGRLLDAGTLTESGIISIAAGPGGAAATVEVTGLLQGSGTILNAGIVNSGGRGNVTGLITIPTIVNTGTIVAVQKGALTIDSAIDGQPGTLDIRAQATLTLNGAVAATQTVAFAGADHADLALGNIGAFAGTIDGLASATSIDFLKLDVTSATTTGTALEITLASGASYNLALGAPLTGASLHLASDSHGGTDLLVQPPTST